MSIRQKLDTVAAVLALCAFSALDAAMSPAQDDVISTYGFSVVQFGWTSAVLFLAACIATPLVGRCGDVFDKRAVLAVSMGVACLGLFVAATSTSPLGYTLGQALATAWVGASTVCQALVSERTAYDGQATGQGVIQGTTGAFATAGTIGAGWVIGTLGTRSLFWLPAIVVVPCVLFLGRTLRRAGRDTTRASSAQALDLRGGALLAAILALLALGLQLAPEGGRAGMAAIACLAAAVVATPGWVRHERRHAAPIIDVGLLARWDVACIHVVALLLGVATTAIFVLLPMLIASASAAGAHYASSASLIGLLLLPIGIVGTLLMPFYGLADHHLRPGTILAAGLACIAVAIWLPIVAWRESWQLMVCTVLFGIGLSFVVTQAITELLRRVPPERAASANGTFYLAKSLGSAVGAQVFALTLGLDGNAGRLASLPLLKVALGIAVVATVCAIPPALGIQFRRTRIDTQSG